MDVKQIILEKIETGTPLTPAEQRAAWGLLGLAPRPTFKPCVLVSGPNGERERCC